MFKSHLFLSPTVVSCDEELNYFILQNEGKLFECSYPKPIHGILGKASMLVAVGDTHKRLRTVALSLITITKSKPGFLNDIETTAIRILHSWKDKSQVIFCQEARKVSCSTIWNKKSRQSLCYLFDFSFLVAHAVHIQCNSKAGVRFDPRWATNKQNSWRFSHFHERAHILTSLYSWNSICKSRSGPAAS